MPRRPGWENGFEMGGTKSPLVLPFARGYANERDVMGWLVARWWWRGVMG
jgi:hypothetical protein